MLPGPVKLALGPMLSQALREMAKDEVQVRETVQRIYDVADAFRAIDAKYTEAV